MKKSTKTALVSIAASLLLPGTPVGLILAIKADNEAAEEEAQEYAAEIEKWHREVQYNYAKAVGGITTEKLEIVPRKKGGQ